MSKCWSRLEAALASELNSSKNVKQFYRKECLSLACQGHFLLVFLVPFSTTVYPFMYLSAVLDMYKWQKWWYWFAFCCSGGSSATLWDVKVCICSPFVWQVVSSLLYQSIVVGMPVLMVTPSRLQQRGHLNEICHPDVWMKIYGS